MQHSIAPTAKFGSPVMHLQEPQAKPVAQSSGNFTTGGVQSITMPFTPAIKALLGIVAL